MYEPTNSWALSPYEARLERISQGLGVKEDIDRVVSKLYGDFALLVTNEDLAKRIFMAGNYGLLSDVASDNGVMLSETEKKALNYCGHLAMAYNHWLFLKLALSNYKDTARPIFEGMVAHLKSVDDLAKELLDIEVDGARKASLRYEPLVQYCEQSARPLNCLTGI